MKWLARVENANTPDGYATKATERVSVVSVAHPLGVSANFTPANDAEKSPGTWPHGDTWNAAEIETFERRLALFTDRGLSLGEAQGLAERLMARDRDGDDRRVCLECAHYRRGRCTNWAAAGFVKAADAELGEYGCTLKRCAGFTSSL